MMLSLKADVPLWRGILSEGVVPHVYDMDTGEILFKGGFMSGSLFRIQIPYGIEMDLYDGTWMIFDIDMRKQFIRLKNRDTGDYEDVDFKHLKHLDPPLGIGVPHVT